MPRTLWRHATSRPAVTSRPSTSPSARHAKKASREGTCPTFPTRSSTTRLATWASWAGRARTRHRRCCTKTAPWQRRARGCQSKRGSASVCSSATGIRPTAVPPTKPMSLACTSWSAACRGAESSMRRDDSSTCKATHTATCHTRTGTMAQGSWSLARAWKVAAITASPSSTRPRVGCACGISLLRRWRHSRRHSTILTKCTPVCKSTAGGSARTLQRCGWTSHSDAFER
mmetsp:Transcript_7229/g.19009  ORF Transcript_7229/g.19009 Transcript_7229/m.19009 type:complete len:230 (-) Transcript_7229:231-920(-)